MIIIIGNAMSLLFGYFFFNRCPQSEAYERRQDPNGMYMKHLLKHVMNDTKVEDVLHQVAGGMDLPFYINEIRVRVIKSSRDQEMFYESVLFLVLPKDNGVPVARLIVMQGY